MSSNPSKPGAQQLAGGFSMVEVALAVGIMAFCLVAFLGQIEFRKMPFKAPGQKASLEWLGINFSYLAATFLMGSPAPYWAGLRMESWMAILLSLLNLAFCGFVFRLIPTKTRGVL